MKHLQLTYNNKETTVEITVSTANNLIEIFLLNLNSSSDAKSADAIKVKTFDLLGHRSDVRSVSFSSCNTAIGKKHDFKAISRNFCYKIRHKLLYFYSWNCKSAEIILKRIFLEKNRQAFKYFTFPL